MASLYLEPILLNPSRSTADMHYHHQHLGSGIGKACALAFAKEGSKGIMVADIQLAAAQEVAEMCRAAAAAVSKGACNCRAEAIFVDVTSEESVRAMMEHAKETFGRIDYCINSAGVSEIPMGVEEDSLHAMSLVCFVVCWARRAKEPSPRVACC